jgi:hypothetical protein
MKNHLFAGVAFLATFSIAAIAQADPGTGSAAGNTTGAGSTHATVAFGGNRTSAQNTGAAAPRRGLIYLGNGDFVQASAGSLALNVGTTTGTLYENGTPLAAQIQAFLRQNGYYLGPIDGVDNERMEQSIEAYQRDHHLPVTGQISGALIDSMGVQ